MINDKTKVTVTGTIELRELAALMRKYKAGAKLEDVIWEIILMMK